VRRLAVLTAVLAAAVGLVPNAGGTAAARQPFLGVVFPGPNTGHTASILARLNPLTLAPVSQGVEMGEYHGAWSLSPDGSQLALGISSGASLISPGRPLHSRIGIIVVDLEAMEVVQEMETGGYADTLAWLAPRRLVASLARGVVVVDPQTGKIVRRGLGLRRPLASARLPDSLVMLVEVPYQGGRSTAVRLAVVDARGRVRSVYLDRIRLSFRDPVRWGRMDRAGLAVDPIRRRAYVVAAGAPVAEVDLRTMRASYRRLDSRTPPGRFLYRSRDAIWFADGHLLVSGRDVVAGQSRREFVVTPGAVLVDTESWRWRPLHARASAAKLAAGRLLAYGPAWHVGPGVGLSGYTPDGRRVFRLLEKRRVLDVQVAADLAYVRTPTAVRVVDVRQGKIVGSIVPPRDLVDVIR
jgi:hypothetical protein